VQLAGLEPWGASPLSGSHATHPGVGARGGLPVPVHFSKGEQSKVVVVVVGRSL